MNMLITTLFTAVEIIGMALATDNENMLNDPISKLSYTSACYHSNVQICVELEWPGWLP